jgi:putative salt-induced outer membrane protein
MMRGGPGRPFYFGVIMKKILLVIFLLPSLSLAEFSHESEVSILSSGGNSELSTWNLKSRNDYKLEKSIFQLSGHYTYGEAAEVESARNWDAKLGYERILKKDWRGYLTQQVEGDKFKGIDTRFNTDIGAGLVLVDREKHKIKTELGYRYTVEKYRNSTTGSENFQKGRAYVENDHQLTETLFFRVWMEYIPNFSEGSDYMINGGSSIQASLTSIFSLKVSYEGNYDNMPSLTSNRKYDYQYTTSLIAKF